MPHLTESPHIQQLMTEANALYKQGKLAEATRKFGEAALRADSEDPAPWRAFSGALFEIGKYEECIEAAERALNVEANQDKIKILRLRQLRCAFHLQRWSDLVTIMEGHTKAGSEIYPEAKELCLAAERYMKGENAHSCGWKEVVDLPRTRPKPGPSDYYPVGHDEPTPAFSSDVLKNMKRIDISLLYGGIGDARHFFQQLIHLNQYLEDIKGTGSKQAPADRNATFEFVLQDVKVHAIARLLILLRLLEEINQKQARKQTSTQELELEEITATAAYIFACGIMPAWAYARLRSTMENLLREAQATDGKCNFGATWLDVPSGTVKQLVPVFQAWLADTKGVLAEEDVATAQSRPLEGKTHLKDYLSHQLFKSSAEELQAHSETSMVFPTLALMREKEPDLYTISSSKIPLKKKIERLKKYSQKNWKRNVTLIQEDEYFLWDNGSYNNRSGKMPQWVHICGYMNNLQSEATRSYTHLSALRVQSNEDRTGRLELQPIDVIILWFLEAAKPLASEKLDIRVELQVDEITHQMDCYQFGTSSSGIKRFDAVFLSNIPDYIGGQLSIVLHALPILKDTNKDAFVQSNWFFNVLLFEEGQPRTIAEYLCLPDIEVAADLLGLSYQNSEKLQEVDASGRQKGQLWAPLMFFHRWETPSKNKFRLPNKAWFLRWLAKVFFKMVLPVTRDYLWNTGPYAGASLHVEQPLSLYAFLRLCVVLIKRGIPSAWISTSFLEPILLSGTIKTTTRPPQSVPLQCSEAINPFWPNSKPPSAPLQELDVTAFLPELKAMLSVFRNVLPLSLPQYDTIIPSPSSLRRLSMKMSFLSLAVSNQFQLLSLLFINPRTMSVEWTRDPKSLPKIILAGKTRGACAIISAFNWKLDDSTKNPGVEKHGVAEWVMALEGWEKMKRERWQVALIMTNTYLSLTDGYPVTKAEERGMDW
ncbi:hypothetical protein BJ508DRAFT_364419 [Ascobolus immersus RN42]|uniref:Uncharacterized protein n=1 Tax=Ascobolus immersus RN42 TaxID=1160509 RepID=A0A3N4HU86_ASCIM|nr:hypothetical protein BJ508DRAFT_364419 [Ascobolus immersus RN42]